MVELELIGAGGQRVSDAALIDTGADKSAFPRSWMKRLGVDRKACDSHPFDSAMGTGSQLRYPDGLRAIAFGREIQLQANFVNTPVALLGREDFLNEFEVRFDQRNSRFMVWSY
jgi:hypothetical protein